MILIQGEYWKWINTFVAVSLLDVSKDQQGSFCYVIDIVTFIFCYIVTFSSTIVCSKGEMVFIFVNNNIFVLYS